VSSLLVFPHLHSEEAAGGTEIQSTPIVKFIEFI